MAAFIKILLSENRSFNFRPGNLATVISQPAFLKFFFLIFHSCTDLYLCFRINDQNIIQAAVLHMGLETMITRLKFFFDSFLVVILYVFSIPFFSSLKL